MEASAKTSVNKNKVPRLYSAVESTYGWKKGSINLDIGAGKYADITTTPFLKERGVINLAYDPYNLSRDHNKIVLRLASYNKVDTVSLSNVLNVIDNIPEKIEALKLAYDSLLVGGSLYVCCYNSQRSGVTAIGTFQDGMPLSYYVPYIKEVFGNATTKNEIIKAVKN